MSFFAFRGFLLRGFANLHGIHKNKNKKILSTFQNILEGSSCPSHCFYKEKILRPTTLNQSQTKTTSAWKVT